MRKYVTLSVSPETHHALKQLVPLVSKPGVHVTVKDLAEMAISQYCDKSHKTLSREIAKKSSA